MGRLLTGLGGAFGLAWLWRFLRREQGGQAGPAPAQADPAAELRARLEQARESPDDRDEFDAAEGQPVDEVERPPSPPVPEPPPASPPPLSLDERRRAIHERAQEALGEMKEPGADD